MLTGGDSWETQEDKRSNTISMIINQHVQNLGWKEVATKTGRKDYVEELANSSRKNRNFASGGKAFTPEAPPDSLPI
jgi:hypothetical protein